MSDLISRQTLRDAIDKRRLGRDARNEYEFGCENMLDWAEFMVEDLPSAERKGKWVNNVHDMPICSECGYMTPYDRAIDDYEYGNYCPNCGARMVFQQGDTDSVGTV